MAAGWYATTDEYCNELKTLEMFVPFSPRRVELKSLSRPKSPTTKQGPGRAGSGISLNGEGINAVLRLIQGSPEDPEANCKAWPGDMSVWRQ